MLKPNNFESPEIIDINDIIKMEKILKRYSIENSAFLELFECLRHSWDDNLIISKHIQQLISGIEINDLSELNDLLNYYKIYYNKVSNYLSAGYTISDKNKDKDYCHDLSFKIMEYYNNEYKDKDKLADFQEDIIYCCDEILEFVNSRFNFTKEDLADALTKLENKSGCDKFYFYYLLMTGILEAKDIDKEFNYNICRSLIELILEYSIFLDGIRRENFKEKMANGGNLNESEKIGRNDLCYCGSGKKYKKCCLHKN